jgi:replicative DNA helicase
VAEPQDIEFAYLGACMTIPEVLESTSLRPDQFDSPVCGKLFEEMQARHERGLGVSQSTMSELLPKYARDIWSSTDSMSDVIAWSYHEDGIKLRAMRRAVRSAALAFQQVADAPEAGMDTIVDVVQSTTAQTLAADERRATSMLTDAPAVLAEMRKSVKVYPSPWRTLNDTISGFAPGRMTVIGARPGIGKSAVATQIAYELASHGPVVVATMEMDKGEVYSRIVSQQAGIYYGGMGGQLPEFLAAREAEWLRTKLRDVRVIDSGTQTVQSIRAAVRATAREQPVAGVIVDYIHLLTTPTRIDNETQRINEITRSLKQLAMDLHVPVIALSQLNRGGDMGMPSLRDLRGSGGIEQDADAVIFLYRDEDTADHQLMVHVAKNRQGPNFVTFALDWQGDFVRAIDPT